LAHSVVVIDLGQVVAEGAPEDLPRTSGGEWIEVSLTSADDLFAVPTAGARTVDGHVGAAAADCRPPGRGVLS
jgi:hypothetical protein